MIKAMFAIVLNPKTSHLLPFSSKRMDTVMTMEAHALTGMQTNHGAQMLKETLRNGADPNISGAMLILSVWTQN